MSKIIADRVLETSTSTGLNPFTLAGAVAGYRAFSAVCANGDGCDYYAEAIDVATGIPTGAWESGVGWWATGGILNRVTVTGSSNGNAAVSWAAGTKRIALCALATDVNALVTADATLATNITSTIASIPSNESLPAISKTIHSGVVVKSIIYDTNKDSDGGAWRKRCSDKSWYTEVLCGVWIGQAANELAARGDNLFTYPEDQTNGAWVATARNGTISGTLTSPSGAVLQLYTENSTATIQRAQYQISTVVTGTYTASFEFKANGRRYASIYPQNATTAYAIYDLNTGTITYVGGANYLNSTCLLLGNGVYRCSLTFSTTAGTMYTNYYLTNTPTINGQAKSYTGGGVSGIYVGAAKLNLGSVATPYVPMSTLANQYYQNTTDGKYYKLAATYGSPVEVFRGNVAEFPEQVAIVAESARVIIYDLTQSSCPMWMVFVVKSGGFALSTFVYNSLSSINGYLLAGSAGVNGGISFLNFIVDKSYCLNATSNKYNQVNVANRNYDPGASYVSEVGTAPIIISRVVNDVAMTVLDGASIDPATGLPVPTIAVATAGGVSVIKSDGSVVNSVSTIETKQCSISLGVLYLSNYYGSNAYSRYVSLNGISASWASTGLFSAFASNGTADESIIVGTPGNISSKSGIIGLALTKLNQLNPNIGMRTYVTNTYNSGWQVGDTRGCYLADTVAETITASGELVVNGTNPTTTANWNAAYYGGSLTISGNTLLITTTGGTWEQTSQFFTTVVGKTYKFSWTVIAGTYSLAVVQIDGKTVGTAVGNGSATFVATLTSTPIVLAINIAATAGQTIAFNNISVKLAQPDRSVKNSGLVINGTLTKSAVATGSQLVAYSGFSSANYLQQPYSSNLDFGTGTWDVGAWINTTGYGCIIDRSYSSGSSITLSINSSGYLVGTAYDGTTTRTVTSPSVVNTGLWTLVDLQYAVTGTLTLYINDQIVNTSTGTALLTLNNTSAVLTIGNNRSLTSQFPGSISLAAISATPATPDQNAYIYRTEFEMFQSNAQVTIDGTSTAITALSYDDKADQLHAGTSWGRSSFRDLVRISSEATTVGAITSLSGNQNSILTAGASGAKYSQPALIFRDELRRKDEAAKALNKAVVSFDYDAVTSQVAFPLPRGYTTKAVFSAGVPKRLGSGKDYTVTFDGFIETVVFNTAPGNTVWVSIMATRNN